MVCCCLARAYHAQQRMSTKQDALVYGRCGPSSVRCRIQTSSTPIGQAPFHMIPARLNVQPTGAHIAYELHRHGCKNHQQANFATHRMLSMPTCCLTTFPARQDAACGGGRPVECRDAQSSLQKCRVVEGKLCDYPFQARNP